MPSQSLSKIIQAFYELKYAFLEEAYAYLQSIISL